MDLEDFSSFINEFLEEAEDHLQTLTTCLFEIEKEFAAGRQDTTAFDALFRAAHTIKGLAGMMEFDRIEALCHGMEDLFGAIRKGDTPISQEGIDALFRAIDLLAKQVESVKEGRGDKTIDVDPLTEDLKTILGQRIPPTHSDEPPPAERTTAVLIDPSKATERPSAPSAQSPKAEMEGEEETVKHPFGSLDDSLVSEFVRNAAEYLDTLDLHLLDFEQDPENMETALLIHHALSGLKGSAGMYGFESFCLLCGGMEKLIEGMEKERVKPTGEVLDLLFACMEKFKALLAEVRERKEAGTNVADEMAQLEKVAGPVRSVTDAILQPVPSSSAQTSAGEGAAPAREPEAGGDEPTKEDPAQGVEKKMVDKGVNTIRVDIERLDKLMNHLGELVLDRIRFEQTGTEMKKRNPRDPVTLELSETNQLFQRHLSEIQSLVMAVRMVPVSNVFNRFPRIVRELARSLDKKVDFVMSGSETELDKILVEEIFDPLLHLIRNGLDHGLETPEERVRAGKAETGTLELKASHEGDTIVVTLRDDGRGMDIEKIREKAEQNGLLSPDERRTDKEVIQLIFEPGFSTAEKATLVSGRGVGMDVVKESIGKLKGRIDIQTEQGVGATIEIRLPLTLAIVPTLFVGVRDETFAIPLSSVVESTRISAEQINEVQGREMIDLRGTVLPVVRLDALFRLDRKRQRTYAGHLRTVRKQETDTGRGRNSIFVVVLGFAEKRLGLIVSELKRQQEVVIKSLGSLLGDVPGISGATITGSGKVCLVLDVGEIIEETGKREREMQHAG